MALGMDRWGIAGHSTGGMLGLNALLSTRFTHKTNRGGTSASKEYGANPDSIYCHKNRTSIASWIYESIE
jgi:hypothetical protein